MKDRLENLPVFASDDELAQALLGARRASEWPSIVPIYEAHGFPKIDRIMGGRYVPAVKAFFDREYGLAGVTPAAPDGVERPAAWNTRGHKRSA